MVRGHVVAWSCDANENIMGRAHINPIFNTRTNQVEFTGGKITELTTNLITESTYTECNSDQNEYLLVINTLHRILYCVYRLLTIIMDSFVFSLSFSNFVCLLLL